MVSQPLTSHVSCFSRVSWCVSSFQPGWDAPAIRQQDECLDADVAKVSLGTCGHTTQKKGSRNKSTWQQNTAHTNLITFFDVVVIVVILILTTQSQSYYFDNLFFLIESLHTPWLPKPWSSPIDFHDHFEIRRGVWNRQAPFQNLKGSLQSQVMPSCFLVSSLFLAAELIGGAGIVCLPFGE